MSPTKATPRPLTAAERLDGLDRLPAGEICAIARETLERLCDILNAETLRLRSGKWHEATDLAAEKTRLAENYMSLARAIERRLDQLRADAPDGIAALAAGHDRLVTQIAENLRVLGTVRRIAEDLVGDVADALAAPAGPATYGREGQLAAPRAKGAGLTLNRAL